MDVNASHMTYVFASYGLSAACIAGLCWYVIARDRALARRRDEQLESGGK